MDPLNAQVHIPQAHISSYDRFVHLSIPGAVRAFKTVVVRDASGEHSIAVDLEAIDVSKPEHIYKSGNHKKKMLPVACRETYSSYTGAMTAHISITHNHVTTRHEISIGRLPVMVKSTLCHLKDASEDKLLAAKEDPNDEGGYFIHRGIERVFRLVQTQKRYFPFTLYRENLASKGKNITKYAVGFKSTHEDGRAALFTLHYCLDYSIKVRIRCSQRQYFIPLGLILKAVSGKPDREIHSDLEVALSGCRKKSGLDSTPRSAGEEQEPAQDRLDLLIQSFAFVKPYTQREALIELGAKFGTLYRDILSRPVKKQEPTSADPEEKTNSLKGSGERSRIQGPANTLVEAEDALKVGHQFVLDNIVAHTELYEEKYQMLVLCASSLLHLVTDGIVPDNNDSLASHELITTGDLFTEILADKLLTFRRKIRALASECIEASPGLAGTGKEASKTNHFGMAASSAVPSLVRKLQKPSFFDITRPFYVLLGTGTIRVQNQTNFSLQRTGFSIVAERLNYWRFFSHFRAVHRGAYFEEIQTTTARRLMPESWGFLCPVHTPDGTPCGLLTHLSSACVVSSQTTKIPQYELVAAGMSCYLDGALRNIPVVQNGIVVGGVGPESVHPFISQLRKKKTESRKHMHAEIVFVDDEARPALYIISTPNRLMRPVFNREHGAVEYIGTTEQLWLQIQGWSTEDEVYSTSHDSLLQAQLLNRRYALEGAVHRELGSPHSREGGAPSHLLSIVAGCTPLGNHNPSPRNMYQCQMAKQSMGTPPYSQKFRTDNRAYVLQYPQVPLLSTDTYAAQGLERYPIGQNVTIAILSYTGYDVEDAVILNKASVDRGFMRGTVLKTERVLPEKEMELGTIEGEDGLPNVGETVGDGDIFYTLTDTDTRKNVPRRNKTMESMKVRAVSIFDMDGGKRGASIKLGVQRVPSIGDKFSSRHGQKGVCSILYEDEDMPFSESGITPDLIINPHAFPSRMSIGMFIECIAGKLGGLGGEFQDGSMFRYGEGNEAYAYFGEQLEKRGFKRGGSEILYSGITGQKLTTMVFFGTVYYQRLRHMVGDKYQVRTTGPIHNLTKQPIGGRKKAGGIRLGEMERDALISHGASAVIQDRLMHCSDGTLMRVCKACGSLCFFSLRGCTKCKASRSIVSVPFPYVFKYFVTELMAMGVDVTCTVK